MPSSRVPRRVALITGADLGRGAPGGTRSYVLGLAKFLTERGIGVALVSNGPVDGAPDDCEILQATRRREPSSLGFQRALRAWSRRNPVPKVGVLHFQRPDDILAFRPQGLPPPAVCTLHGNPGQGIRRRHGSATAIAYKTREARGLREFRAIIAVDNATAEVYRMQYPSLANRIHVVPLAVSHVSTPSCGTDSATSVPDGSMTFLYAGRLSEEKRVGRIIEALRQLDAPNVMLLIAGTGPEERRLRKLANGSGIHFLGNIPHDEMTMWYRRADALVLASEYEGLPTVALESLACGCPVVALAGCGLDSLLDGQRGVLAKDIRGLPEAMRTAARMKRTAHQIHVPPEYTWSRVGLQIMAIYAAVAPEAPW